MNVAGLRIVVFNPLPWTRDGMVDFAFPFMGSVAGKTAVTSVDDGAVQALQFGPNPDGEGTLLRL